MGLRGDKGLVGAGWRVGGALRAAASIDLAHDEALARGLIRALDYIREALPPPAGGLGPTGEQVIVAGDSAPLTLPR